MLRIVDRYLLAEIAKVFAAIIVTLLLVTVSVLFLRTLEQVNVGALTSAAALRFLAMHVLGDMASLLPPAFFIAVLVTLGRLARDSELIALGACGLGPVRIYRALLGFAVPLSLVTAWFSLFGQPYASLQIQMLEEAQDQRASQVAGLQPGRFYQQSQGRITFYAAAVDEQGRFRNVFLRDRRSDRPRLVLSERGSYQGTSDSGRQRVVLEQGRRYEGEPGQADFAIGTFERYTYFLESGSEAQIERRRRASLPTEELIGSSRLFYRAELAHRLAAPLAIYALSMIAIPLTNLSPRQKTTGRMLLAFVAYFAFFNLQRLAETWFTDGVTPAWLGTLWYQPAIVAVVYAALLPASFRVRRLLTGGWTLTAAEGCGGRNRAAVS